MGVANANPPVVDLVGVTEDGHIILESTNGVHYSSTTTAEFIASAIANSALEIVGTSPITVDKTPIKEKVDGVETDKVIGYKYTVGVTADGSIESGNTGLITGGTVYEYVTPASATYNYISSNKTVAENLIALDSAIQSTSPVKVVGGTHTTVTEGTESGAKTYAVNVVTDGVIEEDNTGIVTGGTVFTALQDKANVSLDNITADGKAVITGLTDVVSGNDYIQVTPSTDADGKKTYTVSVLANGEVEDGNTGIVTGGTVYEALTEGLDGKANTDLDNISDDGKQVINEIAKGAVKVVDGTNTTVTEGTDGDAKTYAVNVVTDGVIEADNTGIVTGGTVYEALTEGLDGKANTDLDNISDNGKQVINEIAKGAVKVVDGTNTTITEGTDGDAKTYAVNVVTDGVIEADNTGIVTGGTVFSEVRVTADGEYIKAANTASGNLVALDEALKNGITFNADNDTSAGQIGLGKALAINGDDNITTTGETGKIKVTLNKELKGLTSIETDSITINSQLTVNGTSTFVGEATFNNNVTIKKDFTVEGDTNLKNTKIDGDTEITQNLTVGGDTNIGGNTTIGGDTTIEGSTEIKQDLSVGGDTNIGGNTTIGGSTTINKDFTVKGDSNLNNVTATSVKVGDTVKIDKNGIDMGGQKITNIKEGTEPGDAVSYRQLEEVAGNVGSRINEVDSRLDKVGAGAAALAALHPGDFDANDKIDIAAGWGHYNGKDAMALGAFYRPDERTIFSIGGAFGNGENMINAGVTFKLDKTRGPVRQITSKAALEQKVAKLESDNEELRKLVSELSAKVEAMSAAK